MVGVVNAGHRTRELRSPKHDKTRPPQASDSPGFKEAFATILPRLIGGEISQGQAARELGISVRSLKRYVNQSAEDIIVRH